MGFEILEAIQTWRTPWLDWVMIFFSKCGNSGMMWIVITAFLLLYKPSRRIGVVCSISLLLSLLFCNLFLKPLILRPRPFMLHSVELLIPPPAGASFPSGHASSSFAAATGLTAAGPKAAIPAYIVAIIISFSRLYLQVHFLGDVLAGAVLGILCGMLSLWLCRQIRYGKPADTSCSGGEQDDR